MPGIRYNFDEEAADLNPAIKMLLQTYSDNMPYPHKFNDALLKAHLTELDLVLRHNIWQERAEHEAHILGPILEMIGGWVKEQGPDKALYGMFEANSCNYQLFENIEVKEGERLLKCPYKEMIEIVGSLGTHNITWDDVHYKWCIPLWEAFAKRIGIEIEVTPGETCSVRIKK